MMHILLLLLKILGWILATILGLIVLLIFIALFIPVRYQVSGECKGTLDSLKGVICFTWLLHLVKGNIIYKNGKMVWAVRIAWKKIKTVPEELSETSHLDLAPEQETRPKEKQDNKTDSPQIKDNEGVYKKNSNNENQTSIRNTLPKAPLPKKHKNFFSKLSELYLRIINAIKTFILRMKKIYNKFKYTIHRFYDSIKSLLDKTDKVLAFLKDETHQSAFHAVILELKRIFRFLKPKKLIINAHFGLEDPSTTGHVLAIISMIYPFLGKHTNIQPDFDQKVLEGNVFITGKIRFVYIFISLFNLLKNKNFRLTVRHIKNFKL